MKPHKFMCLALGVLFLAACAPTKLPPIPVQDSKWCAAETCDAILFITALVIGPDGRSVGEPFIQHWRMPMARCQAEIAAASSPANHWQGPIGNLPGYSRANSAWCEPYPILRRA